MDEKRFDSDNRSEDYQAYENLVKETIDYESLEVTHHDDIASSEAPEQIIRHIATQKNGLENRFLISIPEPLSTRGSIGQVMKL